MGILRHRARHGDRPLGERGQRVGAVIRGGGDGLPVADEHAQPEVAALRAHELLWLTQATTRVDGIATDEQRIGGIRALARRPRDEAGQQIDGITCPGRSHGGRKAGRGWLLLGECRVRRRTGRCEYAGSSSRNTAGGSPRPPSTGDRFDPGRDQVPRRHERRLARFGGGLLGAGLMEDDRTVLGADVGPLTVHLGRVVHLPEEIEEHFVADPRGVENDAHDLRMPGPAAAHVMVARLVRVTAAVADRGLDDPVDTAERRLDTPETARTEDRRLGHPVPAPAVSLCDR